MRFRKVAAIRADAVSFANCFRAASLLAMASATAALAAASLAAPLTREAGATTGSRDGPRRAVDGSALMAPFAAEDKPRLLPLACAEGRGVPLEPETLAALALENAKFASLPACKRPNDAAGDA